MAAQFNRRNGSESLLCDVIVVLNIAVFLRQWVICGEGFGSKYKAYFTWGMAKEFAHFSEGIIGLFIVLFAVFHNEVTNRLYHVSFELQVNKA